MLKKAHHHSANRIAGRRGRLAAVEMMCVLSIVLALCSAANAAAPASATLRAVAQTTTQELTATAGTTVGQVAGAAPALRSPSAADQPTPPDSRAARSRWMRAKNDAAASLLLEPKSVDRILIVDTWHHIANRSLYTARLKAALRPFGQVVVVDFRREAHRGPPPEHRIAPDEVVRELEGGGLDARVVDAGLPEQYVVVGTTS